jgi:putative ABC transport system ATP-binding protein
MALIELNDISKVYQMGEIEVHALRGVSLAVERGEMLAIMGASGSGKSTLMNVVGCLDQPSTGTYRLDGQDVGGLNDDRLAEIRNRQIGFVFQTFNLLPRTSAMQNVMLPMIYDGVGLAERRKRSEQALIAVGLAERMHHAPNELSGGQQQRVAIARAIVNRPLLLLADEPTGALDTHSAEAVMNIFQELHASGMTIVMVTHSHEVACHSKRIIQVSDGHILNDRLTPAAIQSPAV